MVGLHEAPQFGLEIRVSYRVLKDAAFSAHAPVLVANHENVVEATGFLVFTTSLTTTVLRGNQPTFIYFPKNHFPPSP